MTITISEKEFLAVHYAINQLEGDMEAATNENYLSEATENCAALYNVINKYEKARIKSNEFKYVRAEVARLNRGRGLRPRDIDSITRRVMRKKKEV